jgi:hypothetical protein
MSLPSFPSPTADLPSHAAPTLQTFPRLRQFLPRSLQPGHRTHNCIHNGFKQDKTTLGPRFSSRRQQRGNTSRSVVCHAWAIHVTSAAQQDGGRCTSKTMAINGYRLLPGTGISSDSCRQGYKRKVVQSMEKARRDRIQTRRLKLNPGGHEGSQKVVFLPM